jgi:NAD(P)-dependent dehydrogenase (short-subunit alcohol dehydrogenase family)
MATLLSCIRSVASGRISDVVDGVLFLETAPFITGEVLHIDGGQIAGS